MKNAGWAIRSLTCPEGAQARGWAVAARCWAVAARCWAVAARCWTVAARCGAVAARCGVLAVVLCGGPLLAAGKVVLVVTADAGDYLLAAGGTVASMVAGGATAYLVRVTNDEKDSWNLPVEEAARRTSEESRQAAKILGIKEVLSLGYRAGELGGVSPTELRDRIMFYIRLYKPDVMFLPNPYAHYVEVLDRFYAGQAAEEAQRAAAFDNFQPAFAVAGLTAHQVGELYYYAQPFDPRRREAETTATFAPQPKVVDILATFDQKLRAAQALRTIHQSMAMRIQQRLASTGRRLPLLDNPDDAAIQKLVEINVRKLAQIAAEKTDYKLAEEFQYAGEHFQIPLKYLGPVTK